MSEYIAEAIRYLYVMTGRGLQFSEDMFVIECPTYLYFTEDLKTDEQEYVLATAEMDFYRKAQASVDTLTSYTTDAMAVTHGDKPFANLQQKIEDARTRQTQIWYKMPRFHFI